MCNLTQKIHMHKIYIKKRDFFFLIHFYLNIVKIMTLVFFFFNFRIFYRTMKCNTWEKDSHGLFDYESKTLHKNQFNITYPGY